MADIKLKIEVNPNAESEFLGDVSTTNLNVVNTSISLSSIGEMEIPKTEFDGSNGLLWGQEDYLVFNDNDELDNVENSGAYLESEGSPDEFFWGLVPQNKEYSVKLTFTGASNLKDIIVFGDKVNNQFPIEAIVDGETVIHSDDYKWLIDLGSESDTHTIELTKWNRANYNACLTLIRVMLRYWEVDKYNGLKSVESLSQSTGQQNEIFYGVIANQGSADIIDINGEIADMLNDGIISNSNVNIDIFANGKQVQKHISNDSDYNTKSGTLSISLTNDIINLDNTTYNGRTLTDGNSSLYEILKDIMIKYGYKEQEIDDMLDYGIKEYLISIQIPYPYLSVSSYHEAINKICKLAQLQFYYDDNGFPKFVNARPIISKQQIFNAFYIPKNYMNGNLEKSIILRNKYDGINMEETVITKSVDTNANCGSVFSDDAAYESKSDTISLGKKLDDGSTYTQSLTLYFKPFTVTIPAKTNLNLNTTYNIKNFSSVINVGNGLLIDQIKTYTYYIPSLNETLTISPQILVDEGWSNIDQEQITNVTYNSDNDTFTISFIACVGRDASTYKNSPLNTLDSQTYRAESATFTFFGEQLQMKFAKQDVSSDGIEIAKTIASLKSNELMQSNATVNGVKISTQIKENIFNDYKNGISNANINLFCGDLYSVNHLLKKNWSNGEILEVNDVIFFDDDINIDKSQKYWRITGRTFSNVGVPKLHLELQEVKVVD